MPLSQLAGYPAENRWCNQILVPTGLTTDEPVQKAIVETSEEGRSEAAGGEEGVGRSFSYKLRRSTLANVAIDSKDKRNPDEYGVVGGGFRARERPRVFVLSRSMRISVPFPYARMSTASLSICSSVKPGLRLIIFRSCTCTLVNRSEEGLAVQWE